MESTSTATLTLEDFMQRYSDEGPFELIDGEFIPVTAQILDSGDIAGLIYRRLASYGEDQRRGKAYIEIPFVLVYQANWVKGSRVPDVMFVTAEHIAQLAANDPEWRKKPLVGAPLLAVEVVSPTDPMTQVNRKVRLYLEDGVRMVWVVEPEEKSVTIYTPHSKQFTRLTLEDTLMGGDILPNFALPLGQLFE